MPRRRPLRRLLRGLTLTACLAAAGAGPAAAKDVTIGMGNFAPYYIAEGETGIFIDLIKAVFRRLPDHQPRFLFGRPNKRLWIDFKNGKIDAVSNMFGSVEWQGCRSEPVFRFRDVAVTRADAGLALKSIDDLAGKRIVTFQGAAGFFGPKFADLDFAKYTEVGKPEIQARILYLGRVDVSVGDMFLFLQSVKTSTKPAMEPADFAFHDILPPTLSRMGFHDRELCLRFDAALKEVRASGEYERIYQTYLKQLGAD